MLESLLGRTRYQLEEYRPGGNYSGDDGDEYRVAS